MILKIAIIGCDNKSTQLLIRECKKQGIKCILIPPRNIQARFVGSKVKFFAKGFKIRDVHAFIFRGIYIPKLKQSEGVISVYDEMIRFAHYAKYELGAVVIDEGLADNATPINKIQTSIVLTKNKIPYPKTYMFLSKEQALLKSNILPYPVILKPADGNQSNNILKANDKDELKIALTKTPNDLYPYMIQEYIENNGCYRILVAGNNIITAVKRTRDDDQITADIKKAIPFIPDKKTRKLAIQAARACNVEIAGIDIICDLYSGKRYILEVNRSPQIEMTRERSGIKIERHIIWYILDRINEKRKLTHKEKFSIINQ